MAGSKRRLTVKFLDGVKKPGKYYDGTDGLFIQVYPTGAKCWQQRVTIRGRRRTLGLGGYPRTPLKAARAAASENHRLVDAGEDPVVRKRCAAVPTLEKAVAAVIKIRRSQWKSARQERSWVQSFERYVYPTLRGMSVAEIEARHVLAIVEPMWDDKPDAARKVRWRLGVVMKWAVAHGYRVDNPAGDAITGALPPNYRKRKHYPAVPHPEVGAVIAKVYTKNVWLLTKLLFEFVVLTAVRSGEARGAQWDEVDFVDRVWYVPATRMKAQSEHRVPLSGRAIAVLEEARRVGGGEGLVFPAKSGGILASTTLTRLLRSIRDDGVPHGFRSSFRDWCGETEVAREVAEACLAHQVGNQVEAAYARSDLFDRRRKVLEDWAAYLADSATSTIRHSSPPRRSESDLGVVKAGVSRARGKRNAGDGPAQQYDFLDALAVESDDE